MFIKTEQLLTTSFIARSSVRKQAASVVKVELRTFTLFAIDASNPVYFSRIQNSQQPTKACFIREMLKVVMSGNDRISFVVLMIVHDSSKKVTRVLMFDKESSATVGFWLLRRI